MFDARVCDAPARARSPTNSRRRFGMSLPLLTLARTHNPQEYLERLSAAQEGGRLELIVDEIEGVELQVM